MTTYDFILFNVHSLHDRGHVLDDGIVHQLVTSGDE